MPPHQHTLLLLLLLLHVLWLVLLYHEALLYIISIMPIPCIWIIYIPLYSSGMTQRDSFVWVLL